MGIHWYAVVKYHSLPMDRVTEEETEFLHSHGEEGLPEALFLSSRADAFFFRKGALLWQNVGRGTRPLRGQNGFNSALKERPTLRRGIFDLHRTD
jgi:hypothetical protein